MTTTESSSAPPEPSAFSPQPSPPDPWLVTLAAFFDYDILHVRQRLFTLAEKYEFADEQGRPRFFVVRPPRLLLQLALAGLISFIRFIIFVGVVWYITQNGEASVPFAIALLISTNFFLSVARILAAPYRHIQIYSDESEAWRLLTITQDNKLGLMRDYTLYDCLGNEIARLRRHTFRSMFRATWTIETISGAPIARVREDSLVRALLRRYLGPLYGLLRTNFDFVFADGRSFGTFDRKLTLTDQYLLDLRGDPQRLVDRRVTLAAAILLDTGESR